MAYKIQNAIMNGSENHLFCLFVTSKNITLFLNTISIRSNCIKQERGRIRGGRDILKKIIKQLKKDNKPP